MQSTVLQYMRYFSILFEDAGLHSKAKDFELAISLFCKEELGTEDALILLSDAISEFPEDDSLTLGHKIGEVREFVDHASLRDHLTNRR